jgi:hypothetical protein
VSGEIGYDTEINFVSPPLKVITEDAIIVSSPQAETAETVIVNRCLPLPQLPTLPKTPTFCPGETVTVLNVGVATTAQAEPPPPPLLPFCALNGIDTIIKQSVANPILIK